VLDRVVATGCAPFSTYSLNFGPFTIAGEPLPAGDVRQALCPRRVVLDQLLADSAVAAGAELREGVTVDELVTEGDRVTGIRGRTRGGARIAERARIVVGADGMRSLVAGAVKAPRYHERPTLSCGYYTYWSGLPVDGFEGYIRTARAFAAVPTNDDLTMLVMSWPADEFDANRKNVEASYLSALDLAPEFAERVRAATRESRFMGSGDLPNFFRKPYGPGWALIGDAGYHKDPITAQGITDAFRDAEAMADAIDGAFSGRQAMPDALAAYQRTRDDAAMPLFEFTCDLASLHPPAPELEQLLGAMPGNAEAMNGFVSVIAGTLRPPDFFAAGNVERIMQAA
jgi:flavin-dependent dehydrogenase